MKRIIFYTRQWRSGTGLYAQGLAEGMAAAGWPITFIAPAGEPTDPAAAHAGDGDRGCSQAGAGELGLLDTQCGQAVVVGRTEGCLPMPDEQ